MALRKLEEEAWGDKVRRAREAAGLTMRAAADRIGAVHTTSHRTLAHIEACRDVPTGSRALTAYIALLSYGFDPDDFGLADSKAAAVVNRDALLDLFPPVPDRGRGLLTSTFPQLGPPTSTFIGLAVAA